ncbi:MAG: methyltransferase domain-containing protein, partial [Muribaculaceae bacterium]|nr:methyltransferase domain-containing protein [Muribaculaceae bacterium]
TMPAKNCHHYPGAICIADDAEARLFEVADNSIDLIVSASTIQWFNSPCSAIRQIERALTKGGIAAITLYTTGTYESLAKATGVSINYVSPDRIKHSLSSNCEIIYLNTDNRTAKFESTRQLIEHMRLTGVNAAGSTPTATLRKILNDNTLSQLEYNSTTIIFQKR